jgi:hypothetical protein
MKTYMTSIPTDESFLVLFYFTVSLGACAVVNIGKST